MMGKLEYWWRHRMVYPFLRLIFHNPRKDSPIDIQKVRSILLLRYDRIGDMIVTTPIFRSLKQINPGLTIGVFASESNAEVIRFNPYVDAVYVLKSHWITLFLEIMKARTAHYDVVINLIFNRTTSGGMLANIISPSGVKVGQGDEKYRFYFNWLLKIDRTKSHMIETFVFIINTVFHRELDPCRLKYEIAINDETKKTIAAYVKKNHLQPKNHSTGMGELPYVVLNLSVNDRVRSISREQAFAIGKHLGSSTFYRTVLLHAPNDSSMLEVKQELVRKANCLPFPEQGNATLLELAALIEGARLVVTPDTSIIHFASAVQTPLVGFYTRMQDFHEWLPHLVKNRIVLTAGHSPTSTIPIPDMISAIDDFAGELGLNPMQK